MSQVPTNKIPSELTDGIIDLINDKESLVNCSVVCKAWLPRSRYHLFDRIHVSPSSLIRWFDPASGSPLTTITPYVRNLLLSDDEPKPSQACSKALNELLPRLTIFTALESLFVSGREIFQAAEEDVISRFLSGFKLLKAIHIRHMYFRTSAQMFATLSAFPNLEIASLDFVSCGRKTAGTLVGLDHQCILSRLRILRLCLWQCNILILDWLMSVQGVPSVEVLDLKSMDVGDIPFIGNFLRFLGPSLRHLELSFATAVKNIGNELYHQITLGNNCRLRSLRFTLTNSSYYSTVYMGWIPIVLSQVTSPHIEEVVILLLVVMITDLDSLDWGAMARTFAQPNFSQLQSLQFQITGGVNKDALAIVIRERLPDCDKRGILYVSEHQAM